MHTIVGFVVGIVAVIILFIFYKLHLSRNREFAECLQRAHDIETIGHARDVYHQADYYANDLALQLAIKKWDDIAYDSVMGARNVEGLVATGKTVRPGSLAAKIVPIVHEELSVLEVAIAGNDEEKLRMAADSAPTNGPAMLRAVQKLRDLNAPVTRPLPTKIYEVKK